MSINIDHTSDTLQGTSGFITIPCLASGVYNLSGTDLIPANGTVQYKTLAANTTFTDSMVTGESIVLRLDGGATYTVTWPEQP